MKELINLYNICPICGLESIGVSEQEQNEIINIIHDYQNN